MESMIFQNNCLIQTVLGPIKTFYLLLKATKAFLNFAVVYFSSSDTILSSRLFQLDAFLPRRQWHLLSIRILPAQRNHMVLWNKHAHLDRRWNTLLQQRNSHGSNCSEAVEAFRLEQLCEDNKATASGVSSSGNQVSCCSLSSTNISPHLPPDVRELL